MTPGLTSRLEEIPGVASVTVDLTDDGGGINIRLVPGADELAVMERLREVLVAYGVRSSRPETVEEALPDVPEGPPELRGLGVRVRIVPLEKGARVEVEGKNVRSFRVVAANPNSIAQGMADAWCRVVGKVPVEITRVSIGDDGRITVDARDGDIERTGISMVSLGWERALTLAVGRAIGLVPTA
jgi:hypothetical protein